MFRSFRLLFVFGSLIACSDSGTSAGSGVAESKKLTELTTAEREDVCQYAFDKVGGQSKTCNSLPLSTMSMEQCRTGFAMLPANCTATVGDSDGCANDAASDLCNLLSSANCLRLFNCFASVEGIRS